MPVNASEVSTLTDEERTQVIKEGVKSVNGSVHFVAGVTGNSIEQVQESVKIVEDLGVDSIITMPSTKIASAQYVYCLLYTSPSPRDRTRSRMPSSA